MEHWHMIRFIFSGLWISNSVATCTTARNVLGGTLLNFFSPTSPVICPHILLSLTDQAWTLNIQAASIMEIISDYCFLLPRSTSSIEKFPLVQVVNQGAISYLHKSLTILGGILLNASLSNSLLSLKLYQVKAVLIIFCYRVRYFKRAHLIRSTSASLRFRLRIWLHNA